MDIRDIARLSGYSLGTVSRVLNGHPNVSDRARESVLRVVKEQGYEPNSNARYLKMQQKTSIAVFVKGVRNMLFADILERVQSLLSQAGEDAVVTYLDEDDDEVQAALRYRASRNPKAIMFLGGDPAFFRTAFSEIDVPAVLLTNSAEELGFSNLSSFSTDDYRAGFELADLLCSRGHTRIGIIGGNLQCEQIGFKRLTGAADALARNGVSFELERDYEACRYSMEDGYDAIVRLLMRTPDLTAVMAVGDVIALGAMRALFDMGKRVPDDLSLTGFDGLPSAQFSVPRLTTVRQDTRALAECGVKVLLQGIEGKVEPVHEFVPFKLDDYESVRRLESAPAPVS